MNLHEKIVDREVLNEFSDPDDFHSVINVAREEVEKILSENGFGFSSKEIEHVLGGCDVSEIIEENLEELRNQRDDDLSYRPGPVEAFGPDPIDDIFSIDLPPQKNDDEA